MKLETGKTYLVNHERKGQFMMKVRSQSNTFIQGIVIGDFLVKDRYGVVGDGEAIGCRTSLILSADEVKL